MNILIINGCNLNFLGIREPEIYGHQSYKDLKVYLKTLAKEMHFKCKVVQTNYEGKIIDYLQKAYNQKYDGIVINPGAFTHYSLAIRDAIKSIQIPTIEVHLSDINNREDFRKQSVISDVCQKTFSGEHFASYKKAIQYLQGDR